MPKVKIDKDLEEIARAVILGIRKVGPYTVQLGDEFVFDAGINEVLRRNLKRYWSRKIQAFHSQF